MLVRELLIESIVRVNLSKRGRTAPPDVMQNAVALFNGIVRDYGNDNVMTAYQAMKDFTTDNEKVVVGAFVAKRGLNVKEFYSLPDYTRFDASHDYVYVDGKFYKVGTSGWTEVQGSECCEYIPDVIVNDLSDIVSICYKEGNVWTSIPKANYSSFYTDGRQRLFTSRNVGENKVEVLLRGTMGKEHKIVYTSAMKFDENSRLEVPEKYITLLTFALCYELGCTYPAVDSTITSEYKQKKIDMEKKVIASNDNDRMILREDETADFDINRVDMWIR